jgi:hypothetical protein
MKSAVSVVNLLLETQTMRVCAACEQEVGPVPVEPGVHKSHGYCRRHLLQIYAEDGIPLGDVQKQPDSFFPPDLSESVDASEAQRFARDTGLALHPQIQYGAMSAKDIAQLSPEQQREALTMANWEFTDRRGDQSSVAISFYAPVNATYDQMAQRWEQKKKDFGV